MNSQLMRIWNTPRTSGFSDPVYAEAYVKIHGFDILLGRSLISCSVMTLTGKF